MSPIKQTFIAADGELREKKTENKLYSIAEGEKKIQFSWIDSCLDAAQ